MASNRKGRMSKEANKTGFIREIRKARELSPKGIIGANIMMAITDFDDMFKIALDEKLDVVIVGAGLLLKVPETVTEEEFVSTSVKIIPKISSARAAALICKVWDEKYKRIPDAFVIEGALAGGHLGFKKSELERDIKPLADIVKETRQSVALYEQKYGRPMPLIAGGGIYSGADMFDIMEAGADGVKMGTRFVTTHECDADIKFKEAYLNAKEEDITIIQSPVGLPGRAIENEYIRSVNRGEKKPVNCSWQCLKTCNYKEVPYCIAEALSNAADGNLDEGFAFAGSMAYKAERIQTVKETINELIEEFYLAESKVYAII
jgi:NAD(P)H-dependent flavin oxidoreductase YrpB (nitropropane dioxygenase family)